jgi:hypothetical protein
MKVGLIGASSRTSLGLLLADLYPIVNVNARKASFLLNRPVDKILKTHQYIDLEPKTEKSVSILIDMLRSGQVDENTIIDYAYRVKGSNSFVFDAYAVTEDPETSLSNFKFVIDQLKSHLVIVDIFGNTDNIVEHTIMNYCDCVLYVFNPDRASCDRVAKFVRNLREEDYKRYHFICWGDRGLVNRRDIQEITGIRIEDITFLPQNDYIDKSEFYGKMDTFIPMLLKGQQDSMKMRSSIHNLFKWICGKDKIKEPSKWQV